MYQLSVALLASFAFPAVVMSQTLSYPTTRKEDVSDIYHGIEVKDPFRWLEDDNAEETKAWVKEQNQVTNSFLAEIPQRKGIQERLSTLWNYERIGMPIKEGGRYFYTYNSGLQNQFVLYVKDSLSGEGRELLDPNKLSEQGTVSLTNWSVSDDGRWLVYGLSKAGSDWKELRVKDVQTGEDTSDLIEWVKFGGASWLKDGSGFFYSRYPEPEEGAALTAQNKNHQLYFHKLGTPQEQDTLVYARPDQPDWGLYGGVTDDGRYLVIHVTHGTDPKNRIYYKDLSIADSPIVKLLDDFDAAYNFIGNIGSVFYFRTDLDAPRYRLVSVNLEQPERENWHEVLPQPEIGKLDSVSMVGGKLVVEYLKDAHSIVQLHDLDGKHDRDVELPGIGSVYGFGGRWDDTETFYIFTSFTSPAVIYRYNIQTGEQELYRQPKLDFDGSRFETVQVFITSKDGTKVPLFITHKKGLKKDGSHPCLLYGYGGFNISLTPAFTVSRAVWLEMGGIHVTANLRGGGEYGAEWHKAGTKLNKQNVFDDFIAAAEWLVAEGYTSTPKLAIKGGSNGGLLVGACMAQRPDLFGACLPGVGVMDMLRFHKFTIGWAWGSDYGTSDDPEEFKALLAYSPLHNLHEGTRYPATMVTTADHDDRVVPAHSFKFAARLQECQAKDGPPVLIRIEESAGHGAGTALNKVITETADEFAFLVRVLNIE